jgi:hypothetical protein
MNNNLKIMAMFFVIASIVFSAGCTGNTQSTQNPAQGAPERTTQPSANSNMVPHHRSHFNDSERPYWNNTSGRPHFNDSERPYWNGSGNVTEQKST